MKTDKRTVTAAMRRQEAFTLRMTGATYRAIGDRVGISPQACHGLIKRELAKLTKQTEQDATVLRALELERLDAMTQALWKTAMTGDCQAVDRLLRISERRSRLLGLDAPLKTAIDLLNTDVRIYLPDNGRDTPNPTKKNDDANAKT